jgi:hypothetical protein
MDWKMRVSRLALGVLGALWVAASFAPESAAQNARGEGPALEFRSDLPWTRLELQGDAKVSGLASLKVPGPLRGDHWLTASGQGVETQRGRVAVRLDESGSRIVSQGEVPLDERMLRSLLFPGYGQYGYREYGKATLMATSAIAAIVATGFAQDKVWDEEEQKDAAQRAVDEATDPTERQRRIADYREALEEENLARDRRNLFLITTGAVWGISMVDAVFFAPKFHVTAATDQSVSLGMRPRSRGQAFARSLLFPGNGQHYNGDSLKGLFVAIGAIGCSVLFLHEQDDYLKAESQVIQMESRVALTPPGPDLDFFESELEKAQDEEEDEKGQRDLTLILLGTYWGVSLLDTVLSFEQPWGEERVGEGWDFGMNATPSQAGVFASRAF